MEFYLAAKALFAFIKPYLTVKNVLILIGLALLTLGQYKFYNYAKSVQLAIDQPIIDAANESLRLQQNVNREVMKAAQSKITTANDSLTKFATEQKVQYETSIKNLINTSNTVIATGLLNHPVRKETNSNASIKNNDNSIVGPVTKGCDGSRLFRDNAVFLTRYAQNVEILKNGYNQCYAQYNEVIKQNELLKQQVTIDPTKSE